MLYVCNIHIVYIHMHVVYNMIIHTIAHKLVAIVLHFKKLFDNSLTFTQNTFVITKVIAKNGYFVLV